jgi:photosystem II stability/assembly factor-like uncharacterized protein
MEEQLERDPDQEGRRLVPATPRARRAQLLVGVAILALAVSGFVYLRPSPGASNPPVSILPPPQPTLYSMQWTSARNGWLVVQDTGRSRSTLFRTDDGGAHWQRLRSTDQGFLLVSFVDSRFGLLQVLPDSTSGGSPPVFQTHDGGSHWVPMQLPSPGSFRGTVFVDPRHGWVMASDSLPNPDIANPPPLQDLEVWRTDDGGQHWQLLVQADANHAVSHGIPVQDIKLGLSFADPQEGWLAALNRDGSPSLFRSRDGGQSWALVPLPSPAGGWAGRSGVASSPRISRDGQGALVVTAVPATPSLNPTAPEHWVLSSRDGGETWSNPVGVPEAPPRFDTTTIRTSPVFADGLHGWWVTGGQVWVSSDSGQSWRRVGDRPAGWSFGHLFPLSGNVAWAEVTREGLPSAYHAWRLYVTHDAGHHWQRAQAPPVD